MSASLEVLDRRLSYGLNMNANGALESKHLRPHKPCEHPPRVVPNKRKADLIVAAWTPLIYSACILDGFPLSRLVYVHER